MNKQPFAVFSFVFVVAAIHAGLSSELAPTDVRDLIGKISRDDSLSSTLCTHNCGEIIGLPKPSSRAKSALASTGSSPLLSLRAADITEDERRQKVNEGMARFMQLLTFFGHVDNFLTQKTHGFLKVVGKAVDSGDEEEEERNYRARRMRKAARRYPPRITTTISS